MSNLSCLCFQYRFYILHLCYKNFYVLHQKKPNSLKTITSKSLGKVALYMRGIELLSWFFFFVILCCFSDRNIVSALLNQNCSLANCLFWV